MSGSLSIAASQKQAAAETRPAWAGELAAIVGTDQLLTGFVDRLAYARDRWPKANFAFRAGLLPGTLPSAVACPGSHEEVAAIVGLANRAGLAVIPFGAGSGVLGAAVPLGGELSLDLKRLTGVVELNETDRTVTVRAGMNGGQFETWLNERGYTCGHYPQSINMSTVGGWVACRGAGQASSRYGKIEDMVTGLKVVLPTGEDLEVRPVPRRSVGPSVADIFVGAEGTMGIVTSVTLRIWELPAYTTDCVIGFPSHIAGLTALRRIMQSELRPTVARLYDDIESAERHAGAEGYRDGMAFCGLVFTGQEESAELEKRLSLQICREEGGVEIGLEPLERWRKERYHSYSPRHVSAGAFMDTTEIAGPWSRLPAMYEEMRAAVKALHPQAHFGAHWSHIYPDGACQYMTLRYPGMELEAALELHRKIWDVVLQSCLRHGGSISHHHGSGLFRNDWIVEELNSGHGLLQKLKDALDPKHLMNPGKLALK